MRKQYVNELFSELALLALLVVGVLLFFVWLGRGRPLEAGRSRASAGELEPALATGGERREDEGGSPEG